MQSSKQFYRVEIVSHFLILILNPYQVNHKQLEKSRPLDIFMVNGGPWS